MNQPIEEMIMEQLQGRADYDQHHLLRLAYAEIIELKSKVARLNARVTDLGWSIDFAHEQLAVAEAQSGRYI